MLRAPPVLLLLLVVFGMLGPPALWGQSAGESAPAARSKGFRLEQNYPNPANPDTYIPFSLEESLFADGEPRVLSIRITNMFGQFVATPKAVGHPRGREVSVLNLVYTEPGRKVAYWDGNDASGRRVPSGVYFCVMQVGDRADYARIIVTAPKPRSRIFPWLRRGE